MQLRDKEGRRERVKRERGKKELRNGEVAGRKVGRDGIRGARV